MENIVYEILEDILGISQAELKEAADLNLIENNLLTSLALVTFFNELEEKLDIEINFENLKNADLTTVNKIISFVKKQ